MSVLFLVGPGSCGKTTVGALLAELISIPFLDLDARVSAEVGGIPEYIRTHGYRAYCEANARIAADAADSAGAGLILATSSGFLTHDGCPDIVDLNRALVRRAGMSVALLPAHDPDVAARVLAFRQVRRYPDRDLVAEYLIAHDRTGRYLAAADRVVLTDGEPTEIANRIALDMVLGEVELTGRAVARRTPAPTA